MTDKKKQIEEMAKISCYVCEFGRMFNGECDLGHDDPCSIALEAAEKLYEIGYRKQFDGDFIEVVRCKDCDVPYNKWTGCPNFNGMIPPPEFFCAKGERKQKGMKGGSE